MVNLRNAEKHAKRKEPQGAIHGQVRAEKQYSQRQPSRDTPHKPQQNRCSQRQQQEVADEPEGHVNGRFEIESVGSHYALPHGKIFILGGREQG